MLLKVDPERARILLGPLVGIDELRHADAFRSGLTSAHRLEAVLSIEATAAATYWSAWSNLSIQPQSVRKVAVTSAHGPNSGSLQPPGTARAFSLSLSKAGQREAPIDKPSGTVFQRAIQKMCSANPSISSRTLVRARFEAAGIVGLPTTGRFPPPPGPGAVAFVGRDAFLTPELPESPRVTHHSSAR